MIQYLTLVSRIDSDQPTGANLIALHDGQLVASMGLRLSAPGGFVNSLYVHPDYRGQAIGENLLRRAAEVCQEHGKPTLGLSVSDQNVGAQRLYRRLGFLPHAWGNEGYTHYVTALPLLSA